MKEPAPKECVIRRVSSNILYITTSTPDAHNTACQLLPKYGKHYQPGEFDRHHTLFIGDEFCANEVAEFIESKLQ